MDYLLYTMQKTFNPNRKLLNLTKLMEHYGQTSINVRYYNATDETDVVTLPLSHRLFIKFKAYIAYDSVNRIMYISPYLLGVNNHWLSTLKDDHANNRISLELFQYEK